MGVDKKHPVREIPAIGGFLTAAKGILFSFIVLIFIGSNSDFNFKGNPVHI